MKNGILSIVLLLFLTACQKESVSINENPIDLTPVGNFAISLIEDTFEGVPIVVVGSGRRNVVMAFERTVNGELYSFTPVESSLPVVMEDDRGNRWDIFGMAVLGPDQGTQLKHVNSGMGFWFAFGAFYPGMEIYGMGTKEVSVNAEPSDVWGVPEAYVAVGAGFDGIPAINSPNFLSFNQLESDPSNPFYLENDDLVIGVEVNGERRAYPHAILDWHEIVNDVVGGIPISVTYCPLTGTGRVWVREEAGQDFTYGVSGFLYNSNILAFDRQTESLWSQLEAISIFGDRKGERLDILPFVETTWGTWQSIEKISPVVLTDDTGFDRDYSEYPYGDYRTSDLISYPVLYTDDRLHKKERVFGVIINGKAKAYRLSDF
jgi:hypothetical protein